MKDAEIKGVLQAQTALLIALARTSLRRVALLQEFERLIAIAVEKDEDLETAEVLRTLRTEFRQAISRH